MKWFLSGSKGGRALNWAIPSLNCDKAKTNMSETEKKMKFYVMHVHMQNLYYTWDCKAVFLTVFFFFLMLNGSVYVNNLKFWLKSIHFFSCIHLLYQWGHKLYKWPIFIKSFRIISDDSVHNKKKGFSSLLISWHTQDKGRQNSIAFRKEIMFTSAALKEYLK